MRTYIVRLSDGRIFYVRAYTKGEVPLRLEAKEDIDREMIASVRRDKADPAPRLATAA